MSEIKSGIHMEKAAGQLYTIHIPHRLTLGEPVPLILLLHWGGKKYRYIGREILEQFGLPGLSSMQAVIVAPDRKRRSWASPKAASDLRKLIEHLDGQYKMDKQKRVVVGYSLGGIGVWYLMAEFPEMFPCGVSIAAPIPDHIDPARWQSPMYAVHSELDEIFPYSRFQPMAEKFAETNAPVEFRTHPDASHTEIRKFIPSLTQSAAWMEQIWAEKSAYTP